MVQYNQNIQLPFKNSHAFIIGIDDYEHLSPLSTAVNDAQGLARQLEEQHGYIIHGPMLNSTKAEMERWLSERMAEAVGPEDRVVIYFAGHGIALDSGRGPHGYLVPADARQGDPDSLLPMQALHQAIEGLPCRHGLLILDCCFSGAFKWASGFRDLVVDLPNVIYEERFWQYTRDPAWQVITSAGCDQQAADSLMDYSLGSRCEEYSGHSPFALALFDGLAGAADLVPREGGDGVITASELYTYLRDRVEDETTEHEKRQTPAFFNLARHSKGQYMFLHPRHRLNLPPTPDRNPYMGLKAFQEQDASLFFGRNDAVNTLVELVKAQPLTVVSGASGTGKSSLVLAGLLPALRAGGWHILPAISPGKGAFQYLNEPALEEELSREGRAALVIDQYEGLAAGCRSGEERVAFEQRLVECLNKHEGLRVIITARSDFEPHFEQSPLAGWWEKGRYEAPAFSTEELREAIVRPAEQEVLFFEPESLVDRLEEAAAHAPNMLPLLSLALSDLYGAYLRSGRQDRSFSEKDFDQMNGVAGALCRQADAVYDSLGREHQNSMRNLLLRMVSFEEEDELATRRIYEEELVFADGEESIRVKTVADKMVETRLLYKSIDARQRVYIEPVHETMLGMWPRLGEWINAAGEERLILNSKLRTAVLDYQASRKPGSTNPGQRRPLLQASFLKSHKLLWANNPYLPTLKRALERPGHSFNASEESFIHASNNMRKRKKQAALAGIAGVLVLLLAALAMTSIYHRRAKAAMVEREATLEEIEKVQKAAKEAQLLALSAMSAMQVRYMAQQEHIRALSSAACDGAPVSENSGNGLAFGQAVNPDNALFVDYPDFSAGQNDFVQAAFSPDGRSLFLWEKKSGSALLYRYNFQSEGQAPELDTLFFFKKYNPSVAFALNDSGIPGSTEVAGRVPDGKARP